MSVEVHRPTVGQSLVPPKAKTKSEQSYRAAALSKHAQKSSLCNRGTRLAQIANAQRPGSNAWAGLLSASSFLEKMLVMIRQHKDIAPQHGQPHSGDFLFLKID